MWVKHIITSLILIRNETILILTDVYFHLFLFTSWGELGACRSLEHLDLSGCEKITDYTLKRLSFGLGDLTKPTCSKNNKDRQAKILKSSSSALNILDKHSAYTLRRPRSALVFKWSPGGQSMACSPVWVLDPSELADIEDAGDWSRRGAVTTQDEGRNNILDLQTEGRSCCCRRNTSRGYRTDIGTAYLQQLYGTLEEMQCGHSKCCGLDTVFRTVQYESQAMAGSTRFRTKCPARGNSETDQSGTFRSLKFLSLSGCYQITDFGLRYCTHIENHVIMKRYTQTIH